MYGASAALVRTFEMWFLVEMMLNRVESTTTQHVQPWWRLTSMLREVAGAIPKCRLWKVLRNLDRGGAHETASVSVVPCWNQVWLNLDCT